MVSLKNKIVFVTGSSKGIGKALAIELLKVGSEVVLNGRDEQGLEQTRKELSESGKKVMALPGDVTDSENFKSNIHKIIETYGRLDVLVLNAGVSTYGEIEDVEDKALHTVMNVNTMAPYSCSRIALPYLKETKGSLIFISSLAALHGLPKTSLYCMSKMALTALAQSLRIDLKKTGVHIGIIYAGFIKNDPEKTTVLGNGEVIPINSRPGWMTHSKVDTARMIIRNIRRRKFKTIHTPIGKLFNYIFRHFPRFTMLLGGIMIKSSEKLTKIEDW